MEFGKNAISTASGPEVGGPRPPPPPAVSPNTKILKIFFGTDTKTAPHENLSYSRGGGG